MNLCPEELKRRYREGRLIPFIGAGVSRAVTWTDGAETKNGPTWRELVNEAARQLGFEIPNLLRARGTDLQILEYFQLRNSGVSKLTNWLVKSMNPPDPALKASRIHSALAALDNCHLFYTTNYDDFLERSFQLDGNGCLEVVLAEHMKLNSEERQVIKFHGSWNFPETMVITESDYEGRLKLRTCLDHRFRSDLLNSAVLFLGYSFRDPNVSYIFRLMKDEFGKLPKSSEGRRAYIALPEPSNFEITLFRERQIDVIGISALNQSADIVQLLTEMKSGHV